MFPITITLHDAGQLTAVMAALQHMTGKAERAAAALGTTPEALMAPNAILQELKFVEAPGKSTPAATEAAKPARGQRTAAADAATAAPEKTVAEPTPTAAAAVAEQPASTAAADAPAKVAYADLQKAVLTLHKADPTKAVPIAKSLGAETFKALPEDKWADALRLVNEAIEQLKVA